MKTWTFLLLSAAKIEAENSPFNWFPGELSAGSSNSLVQNGILFPLVVQAVPDSKYRLVDGFKRYAWLASQKIIEITDKICFPCFVLPEGLNEREIAQVRLENLVSQLSVFPGIYVAQTLAILRKYGFSKQELILQVLPRFSLPSSEKLLRQLAEIHERLESLEVPDALLRLGSEDLLPLLKFSHSRPDSELSAVISLATKMKIGGKKWRSLLQLLNEVSRLREISTNELLKLPEITEILLHQNLQGPVRYRLLKQQLEVWRYPELSKLREKFEHGRQRLKLPQRIVLENDRFFENDELSLTLKIRSVQELQKYLKYLESTENAEGLWKDLFAIQKCLI